MVSYNITLGAFSSDSATAFTQSGTWIGGSVEFVPGFGVDGILVLLGGVTTASEQPFRSLGDLEGEDYIKLKNITIYDPSSKEWYWQETAGPVPRDRTHACTVGVSTGSGDNRTHEM